MGLGNYEQNLIKSIAENDIREARKWAVAALNADTTQKNKDFVTRYKNILTSEGAGMIELPGNLNPPVKVKMNWLRQTLTNGDF